MNHYFQLHHARAQRYGYPEFRLHERDEVSILHAPVGGLSFAQMRDCESPKSEKREVEELEVEELERSEEVENGVVVLNKVECGTEEAPPRLEADEAELDNEEDKRVREQESKEDDKNAETFVAVIAQSILSVPTKRMTLSSIYSFIAKNYPHFDKEKGPGWRNSVRHNLSSNDCFVKASRAENGKGHYWMIHPKDLPEFSKGNFRRRRKPRRPKCSHSLMFREGPYFYHTYGLGYSPYSYPHLRTSQDLADLSLPLPYGSTERALAQRLRTRTGLIGAYEESASRVTTLPPPTLGYPSASLAYRSLGESSPSRTQHIPSHTNYSSSFHPVQHHSCACHR